MYVISGRIRYSVDREIFELGPGDTIWHPSTQPHSYENISDSTAVTLHVNTLPVWFHLNTVEQAEKGSKRLPRGRGRQR